MIDHMQNMRGTKTLIAVNNRRRELSTDSGCISDSKRSNCVIPTQWSDVHIEQRIL